MRRLLGLAFPAALLALGASQVASGSWIHAKAMLAQALLERAWQQTLDGGKRVRPWPWADTWPVARLKIPRLDTSLIVLSGASGRTLAFGPGHTPGSALPGGAGTAIISGHRDTHFSVLREVRRGDEVLVERPDGGVVRYWIDDLRVADSRTASLRAPGSGRALLLVTCWPFRALTPGGPLRYVVTARAATSREGQTTPRLEGVQIRAPAREKSASAGTAISPRRGPGTARGRPPRARPRERSAGRRC